MKGIYASMHTQIYHLSINYFIFTDFLKEQTFCFLGFFFFHVTSIQSEERQEFHFPGQMSKTFKQLSDQFKLSSEVTLNQV